MPADPTKAAVDDAPPVVGLGSEPPTDPAAASRQCSRCRASFPSDPTLFFNGAHAWWLCPSCEPALLGRRTGGG